MEEKVPEYCYGKTSFYHKGEHIYDLFAEKAAEYPNNIAVIAEGTEYTYTKMKKLIDNAAAYFQSRGIRSGDRVALMGSRRVYTIAAIYALLKLNAAYVPLEENYPKKRVEFILSDCKADKIIVTDRRFENVSENIETIYFDKDISEEYLEAKNQIESIEDPCCYIIYTSGTTGQPKGTAIRSDDLLNLVYWYIDVLSLDPDSRVLLLNAFGFDASVKNIFAPLLCGGTLILGSRDLYNIDSILGIMCASRPTVLNSVPGLFAALIEADREKNFNALSSLEYAVLGGERLTNGWAKQLIRDIPECRLKVLNVYGPTECTSVSSSMMYSLKELAECESISIGRPIHNKRIYISDKNGSMLPMGEKGEIVIAGVGIADNYLNHKSDDVFSQDAYLGKDTMYKSGDIGYYDKNGNIIFCGRSDSQVKLNGHRIELEEIIKTGIRCSGSSWFDVIITDNSRLIGFIKDSRDRSEEIKAAMNEWCMDYMVPYDIISVENIPMTPHGKTDHDALKNIAAEHMRQKKAKKPLMDGKIQNILAEIWQELLGHRDFNVDEKFFDAGGNSLQLFKMKMLIKEKTGFDADIVKLMNSGSIENIAKMIDSDADKKGGRVSFERKREIDGTRNKFRERMELLKSRRRGSNEQREVSGGIGNIPP